MPHLAVGPGSSSKTKRSYSGWLRRTKDKMHKHQLGACIDLFDQDGGQPQRGVCGKQVWAIDFYDLLMHLKPVRLATLTVRTIAVRGPRNANHFTR